MMPADQKAGGVSEQAREALIRRRWWIAALLFLAGLINYFDRTIVSVALPVIAADLRMDKERMGVLLSAFFWSYAAMQVPIGWLADRWNLRWMYAACFALWSVMCGLTSLAATLGAMLVLRVLLGIGESIYLPGGMKMVSLLFPPERRGVASGLVNCGTRAGLAFGAPLIAALVVRFGWRAAFAILGFGSLVWLIPWLAAFPRSVNTAAWRSTTVGVKPGAIDRSLLGVCAANVGYGYFFYVMVTWLPTYLQEARHLKLQTASLYLVVPYLTFAVGEPIGGWIADRLIAAGRDEVLTRKTITAAAFFSSLLLIAAALEQEIPAAIAFLGGASLVGLSTGNLYALVQRFGKSNVGFSMGLFNLAGNIPGVVAPIVTGEIVQKTGSYFPAFVVAVAVLLAALVPYWLLARNEGAVSTPG
jgi:MFS family permease